MVIKINEIVNLAKSRYSTGRIYAALFKIILIMAGAVLPVLSFVSVFSIEVSYAAIIITAFIGTVCFILIVGGKKTKNLLLVLMGIVFIVYVYFFRDELRESILSIANDMINAYNLYFKQNISTFVIDMVNEKKNNSLLICGIVFEFTFILVTATWYRIYSWVHMVITAVFVVPMLILGRMPGVWYSTGLVIYQLAIFAGRRTTHQNKKHLRVKSSHNVNDCINAKIFVLISATVLVSILCTMLVVNPSSYNRDKSLEKAKKYLVEQFDKFKKWDLIDGLFGTSDKASGGMAGGKLGRVDSLEFENVSAMKVTVPAQGDGFYIRGFVGNDYRDNSWTSFGEQELSQYMQQYDFGEINWMSATHDGMINQIINNPQFSNLYQSRMADTFAIELTGADSGYFYSPYFSDLSEYNSIVDTIVTDDMPDSITIPFVDYLIGDNYDELSSAVYEEDWEHERYTLANFQSTCSEQVSSRMYLELYPSSDNGLVTFNGQNYQECIDAVKNYLVENMEYTTNPGRIDEDKDFLETFMLETKKGYCSHFATAATMMFRAEGIPARYVEGYILSKQDIGKNRINTVTKSQQISNEGTMGEKKYYEVDVKDSNAHAWVEIYIGGFGWVPVEVTPGYSNALDGDINDYQQQTTTQSPTTTGQQTTTTKKNQQPTTAPKATTASPVDISHILYVLAVMAILIGSGLLVYYVQRRRKLAVYNYLHSSDYHKNIGYAYSCFVKLMKSNRIELSEKLMSADKAKVISEKFMIEEKQLEDVYNVFEKLHFGGKGITFEQNENDNVVTIIYEIGESSYNSGNVFTKLKIKYIWCLYKK